MKKVLLIMLGFLLVFCSVGTAKALMVEDIINVGSELTQPNSYLFPFDITGPNFDPTKQHVLSASLRFYVPWDMDNDKEYVDVAMSTGEVLATGLEVDHNTYTFGLGDLSELELTGQTTALLHNLMGLSGQVGDFYLDWISIEAEVSSVPEPASMILLGSGLIGLAGISRKKFFGK